VRSNGTFFATGGVIFEEVICGQPIQSSKDIPEIRSYASM
jgi:hypothetical protein